jgi:hypothetical protein
MTVVEDLGYEEPATWDEAAELTVSQIFRFNLVALNRLDDMRAQLDYMISKNVGILPVAWMSSDEMSDFWKILGAITRAAAAESKIEFFGINPERAAADENLEKMIKDIAGLIIRKQRDYGSDNILRFGRLGLLVRVHDKIARLENLTARGTEPSNESISDNYMDVIGYCTVAMMFERGWFTLPLQEK